MTELAKKYNWERVDFGKIKKIIDIPNLIEIQKRSYSRFLQKDVSQQDKEEVGIESVFRSVFPIWDFNEMASLEYVRCTLDMTLRNVIRGV